MEVAELPSTHKLCYLGDCNFTRASVAYDYAGNEVPANTPRFKHRVPDVTVRNLLTGNQSDGGDTLNPELLTLNQRTGTDTLGDTTGFETYKGDEILSSSTTQAHSGTKSLKVVTDGSHVNEGVRTSLTTVTNGTVYIGGTWVYAPNGQSMRLRLSDATATSVDIAFTGTGAWQWVEAQFTGTVAVKITLVISTRNTSAVTFYVDDLRLAKTDTTGRAAEIGTETITITGEESHQGYRSAKVVTAATANSGFKTTATTATPGTIYTKQVRVKATNGKTMKLAMRNNDGTSIATTSFTATGGWDLITVTGTPKAEATGIICAVTNDSAEEVTFKTDTAMLETGSTAHDWAYGGSSYSSYKTEYGCLIEEAHTNLFTANVSTGTDSGGDTTGFAGAGTVAATISSSTTQALQGTKSLKVITSGTGTGEGVSTSSVNIANTTAHTQTLWVYAPLGSQLKLTATNQGATATAGTLITGNGAWQLVTLSGTSSSTSTVITIATVGSAQAITFYLDMLQLTATAYPLSWTLGGTTMAAESLTAPSSVLNIDEDGYSNLLEANVSSGTDTSSDTTGFNSGHGAMLSSSTEQYHQGSRSLKVETPGSVELEGTYISTINTVVGEDYTFSGWFYVPTGATLQVQMYQSGTSVVQNINGSGDWQYIDLTKTSTTTSMAIYIQTIASAQAITFYIDELQVSATSTAKDWILGGTYSGLTAYTIEGEVFATIPMFKYVTNRYSTIFYAHTAENRNLHTLYKEVGALQFRYKIQNEAGTTDYNIVTNSLISEHWNHFNARLDADSSKLTVANSSNTKTIPPIGSFYPTMIYLGCGPAVGSVWRESNAIIRNIVISKTKRTDEDVTARAESELPVADEYCTMIYPLVKDLSAYRVVAK